ncbi:hypothetical protein K439DRAFT_1631209, partial [Ramaria rubella]
MVKVKAGLNLRRHSYVTNATLYRWIRLVAKSNYSFGIFPVQLTKSSGLVLYFTAEKAGDQLSENDEHPTPGDYGLYKIDLGNTNQMDISMGILDSSNASGPGTEPKISEDIEELSWTECGMVSDALSEASYVLFEVREYPPPPDVPIDPRDRHLAEYPPHFKDAVSRRDQCCCITGISDSGELEVTWIYLPTLSHELSANPHYPDPTPYRTISNAILLHKALTKHFEENSIGIDIDDNYRLVIFKNLDLGDMVLPSHVSSENISGDKAQCLKLHFRRCLLVHFCGGDIWDQYNKDDVLTLMEDLGVFGEGNTDLAPLDDPRWQTEIGKEILEGRMAGMFEYGR